ncbi:MAG: aconitate hydratase [Bacteroidia bacterium]
MPLNVTQKLIRDHLVDGTMTPGNEIGLRIDQTLTQDATGTMVMLELEAMGLDRAKTEVSVQYVDHNLLQTDYKNADDHLFLMSAASRFGIWYSRPGNGVSHPVHQERFGKPGRTMAGSDSHTPAAGAIGMLALGAGGLDVAFAIAGKPLYMKMPKVLGVKLTGKLPDWVSAKDVVLEMLRRYDVKGARGMVIEYYGPGLNSLSCMDRHVIANMGTEMGATSTVFPSDDEVKRFLKSEHREQDWIHLVADEGAGYDINDELDLNKLEPMIALPGSPGNVKKVREVEGRSISQAVIGSSANPGLRDFWMAGQIVKGKTTQNDVSFDINPTSRQLIENLSTTDSFASLIHAGARFHQAGCLGCIGMGQAPASGRISLRTMPRNFPGRSGTREDAVYLCSPETAAASALTGKITDPRDLEQIYGMRYPQFVEPDRIIINNELLVEPPEDSSHVELVKGPNIQSLPEFAPLADALEVPVLLKMSDNISTDEIMPAGSQVLPLRSNIPEISKYSYFQIDQQFYEKALEAKERFSAFTVVAGENYAQGSSREHAAIAPRYLGQAVTIAKSYARIGWQNMVNFAILPLEFADPDDYDKLEQGDILVLHGLHDSIKNDKEIILSVKGKNIMCKMKHSLSERQKNVILAGGVINLLKQEITSL